MVITSGKNKLFFLFLLIMFWANHPVFPESTPFAIMLISSCVSLFSLFSEAWPEKTVPF